MRLEALTDKQLEEFSAAIRQIDKLQAGRISDPEFRIWLTVLGVQIQQRGSWFMCFSWKKESSRFLSRALCEG